MGFTPKWLFQWGTGWCFSRGFVTQPLSFRHRGVNDNQFFCSLLQSQQAISESLSVGGGAAIHNNPHAPGVGGICALVEEPYQVASRGTREMGMGATILEPMILHEFGGTYIQNYQLLCSYLPTILAMLVSLSWSLDLHF